MFPIGLVDVTLLTMESNLNVMNVKMFMMSRMRPSHICSEYSNAS
jgi:hypothetical protein